MENMENFLWGHEGQNVEFKTSFYVSAGDHSEDQQFVVFRAACAMANADGGDIYIGIDDKTKKIARGPHYGVKGDIEKMPNVKTNDGYARYVNDRISAYFHDAKYVRSIVIAEETDYPDVIAIHVKKADRMVYMHKRSKDEERLAFRREGGKSRLMDKSMVSDRENTLAKEKMENAKKIKQEKMRQCLQEAIDNKRKVVLFRYRSTHGNHRWNRYVEPVEFICDGRSIWAYEERNEGNNPLRQFRLDRMDNVKVLDEPWEHDNDHQKAYVDAFEYARPIPPTIHITIQIGVAAMNHLVDNCPESVKHISESDEETWWLDTDVHDLEPVKKFCQEFMDTITVYVPDELKEQLGIPINSTEHRICGFKGMILKIKQAIFEYRQERKQLRLGKHVQKVDGRVVSS